MKKILFTILLLFLLSGAHYASAEVLAGYVADPATATVNDEFYQSNSEFGMIQQGFTLNSASTVTGATLYIYDATSCSGSNILTVRILSQPAKPLDTQADLYTLASTTKTGLEICSEDPPYGSTLYTSLDFSPVNLPAGTYWLEADYYAEKSATWYYVAVSTSTSGFLEPSYGYRQYTNDDDPTYLDHTHFFTIEGSGAPTPPTFLIGYPPGYPVVDSGFNFFGSYDWMGTTPDPTAQVRVLYVHDLYNAFSDTEALGATSTTGYWTVAKTHALVDGSWTIQAFLESSGGSVYASSSIEATIIQAAPVPSSTVPTASTTITCDPASGFWSNSFCNVFTYLFTPPANALDKFSNFTTTTHNGVTLYYKPPIGYFNAAKTLLLSISTSTASSTPMPDLSDLDVPIFGYFKGILSVALWVLFLFWVFHRIQHLPL